VTICSSFTFKDTQRTWRKFGKCLHCKLLVNLKYDLYWSNITLTSDEPQMKLY